MVLESTYLCVDSSEYQRNGDFTPSRMMAQVDAVNLVSQCKLRANAENQVGLIGMTDRVDVLATLTTDNNKIFMKLHNLKPRGYCQFVTAIKIAHLALKHRQNRNHKMRIVIFIGSPVTEGRDELVQVAKKLKKEKVSVDAVVFGEKEEDTSEKLTAFIETLNGKDGTSSHLVVVPAGSALTEALMTSPVCRGEDGGPVVGMGAMGGAGFGELGMDPNEDPELAMALRVSLEEQRQRQEQEAQRAAQENAGEGSGAQPMEEAPAAAPVAEQEVNFEAMTEEEQLAYALRMSLAEGGAAAQETPMETEPAASASAAAEPKKEDEKKDEKKEEGAKEDENLAALMEDPAALESLVATLPGVDPNNELIQQALADAGKDKDKKDKDKKGGTDGNAKK